MPISFLEQRNQPLDPKLKARLLVREFASYRYGIFKESGFRADPMYPPFSSLAGLPAAAARRPLNRTHLNLVEGASLGNQSGASGEQPQANIAGFDEHWNECSFDTQPQSGLPAAHALNCAPFFTRSSPQPSAGSFNLMSADPFSHVERDPNQASQLANQAQPIEWRDLADSARFHFCGDNFPPAATPSPGGGEPASGAAHKQSFSHNQLATNKQNVMCNERSAMEVIKSNDDFRRSPFR